MSAGVYSRQKTNTLPDAHTSTNLSKVCVQENKRQDNTKHDVRHQIGLVCPIKLKNHIPEALQVHFTQALTEGGGAVG